MIGRCTCGRRGAPAKARCNPPARWTRPYKFNIPKTDRFIRLPRSRGLLARFLLLTPDFCLDRLDGIFLRLDVLLVLGELPLGRLDPALVFGKLLLLGRKELFDGRMLGLGLLLKIQKRLMLLIQLLLAGRH